MKITMRMVGWMIKVARHWGVCRAKYFFGGVPLVGEIRFLEFEDESAVSGHGYVLGECYGFTGDYIACNGV